MPAGDATLVNVSAPVNVIHPILFMEYATLSRMLGPLHLPLKFDEPSPLLLVPETGGEGTERSFQLFVKRHSEKAGAFDYGACGTPESSRETTPTLIG